MATPRMGKKMNPTEVLEGLQNWVRDEINKARDELKTAAGGPNPSVPFTTGRLDAMRDVLAYLGVDET